MPVFSGYEIDPLSTNNEGLSLGEIKFIKFICIIPCECFFIFFNVDLP